MKMGDYSPTPAVYFHPSHFPFTVALQFFNVRNVAVYACLCLCCCFYVYKIQNVRICLGIYFIFSPAQNLIAAESSQ